MGYKYNTEEEKLQGIAESQKKYKETEKYKEAIKRSNDRIAEERRNDAEKREKYNAYQREYRARKKLEIGEEPKHKLTEEEKSERKKQRGKRYYQEHRAERIQVQLEYYAQNREKQLANSKEYYETHKAEIAERKRQWRLRKLMEQRQNGTK